MSPESNAEACAMGTNPCHPDTDGDGTGDSAEAAQGSDPNDASDGGVPGSRVPVSFTFGDHSGSHSEKYTLSVTPESGLGTRPSSFAWLNENYGVCETKTAYLKPGWRYAVRLDHSGTKEGLPTDYDYTLRQTGTLPSNVVITDDQSLFCVDDTSSSFAGAGRVAYVDVLKFEFITPAGDPVSSPHATVGVGQNEFTYDDETSSLSLSLQVKVWPQLPSDWAPRTGTFNLSAIEGAELEWNRGVDGRVTAIGNTFTARATYRGYPTHNSGFGRKTVTFAFEDIFEVTVQMVMKKLGHAGLKRRHLPADFG